MAIVNIVSELPTGGPTAQVCRLGPKVGELMCYVRLSHILFIKYRNTKICIEKIAICNRDVVVVVFFLQRQITAATPNTICCKVNRKTSFSQATTLV